MAEHFGVSKKSKARALYSEVCNVGRTIEASKKRVTWRISTEKGTEHEISLTHSLGSGKKVLRVDGVQVYKSQSLVFGEWDYIFHLKGGNMLHCIIKPCADLNDMYDLIVDDISYRRLPKGTSNSPPKGSLDTRLQSLDNPMNSHEKTPKEEKPWTCPRCTLLNQKPHAIVCEACESPRPKEGEQIVRRKKSSRSSKKKSATAIPKESGDGSFDPFGTASVEAVRQATVPAFDPFESPPEPAAAATTSTPEFNPFENTTPLESYPISPTPCDNITEVFSQIDFSPPVIQQPAAAAPASPVVQFNPNDLWSSNMVNLDLKQTSVTGSNTSMAGPTLEQARQTQPRNLIPVMPASPIHHMTPPPQQQQQQQRMYPAQYATSQLPMSPMIAVPAQQQYYTDPNDPFAGLS